MVSSVGSNGASTSQIRQFVEALKTDFSPIWERVHGAYHQTDALGRKLAQIDNTSAKKRHLTIRSFPKSDRASSPYLGFDGLSKHLLTVIGGLDKQGKEISEEEKSRLSNVVRGKTNLQLPSYKDINVLNSFIDGHPLIKYIAAKRPLLPQDYLSLVKSGFADLHILRKIDNDQGQKVACGVLEASCGFSHGDHAWTRDMAAVALGKLDINQAEFAKKIALKLYQAYASPSQRQRIKGFLDKDDKQALFERWDETDNPVRDIPHTKFNVEKIEENGQIKDYKLVDYSNGGKPWGMQQLDAFGYLLQLMAKLAKKDYINIVELDSELREETNASENQESTLVSLARMLVNIEYWDRNDTGTWEYPSHKQRASSIAACVAGLRAIKNLFEEKGYFENCPLKMDCTTAEFRDILDHGISEGDRVLFEKRIPKYDRADSEQAKEVDEGTNADMHKHREKDAALLFMLILSDPDLIGDQGISDKQRLSILRTVYELMGDIGFKRFPTDEYMGQDWVTDKNSKTNYGEHAENNYDGYKAAEWSFFDPYLATYFYKEFTASEGKDLEAFLRADRHARRALAQITKTNYQFIRRKHDAEEDLEKPNRAVKIPAGEVMEHYWYSTKDPKTGNPRSDGGTWMPGENYRLNWTKIALQQMIYHGSKAGEIFVNEYPNGWNQYDVVGLNLSALGKRGKETVSKQTVDEI